MKTYGIKTLIVTIILGISCWWSMPVKADVSDAPEDAEVYAGHYYKIYNDQMSWDQAKEKCKSLGGHLATITNEEEQKFIEGINKYNNSLWIGGYRKITDKEADKYRWYWVNGEVWNYTNWGEGEPNNSSNVISNENCVAVWPKKWNDLNTSSYEQSGFICEWDDGTPLEKESDLYTSVGYYKPNDFEWAVAMYKDQFSQAMFDNKKSIYIPGLSQTVTLKKGAKESYVYCDNMVPQGICFYGDKNQYMLISAYCGHDKEIGETEHKSVLYVLRNPALFKIDNNSLLTTIALPDGTHAGGISCDNDFLWVASTDCVRAISKKDIDDAIAAGQRFCKVEYKNYKYSVDGKKKSDEITNKFELNTGASFVTCSNGLLNVGEFKSGPIKIDETHDVIYQKPYLCGYKVKLNGDTLEFRQKYKTKIPYSTQGVEFCQYNGQQHIIYSISWGRFVGSELKIKKFSFSTGESNAFSWNSGSWNIPCMSEDVCTLNGRFYNCYESASNLYDNAWTKVDRITSFNLRALGHDTKRVYSAAEIEANKESEENEELEETNEEIISSGTCGENVIYYLDCDGELVLEGYGDIYDYEESPFLEYKDQIRSVSVPFAVTKVGNNAFKDLENLEIAYILGDFDQTTIGQAAFANCTKLTDVYLGDREVAESGAFVVQESAFMNCNLLENFSISASQVEIDENSFAQIDNPVQISTNVSVSLSNNSIENMKVIVHEHDYKFDHKVESTCGEDGYNVYSCDCGAVMYETTEEATDEHNFVDGKCTECGTIDFSLEEHVYGEYDYNEDATCTKDGTKTAYCVNCGEAYITVQAEGTAGHDWDDGVVTKKPTTKEKGEITYTCLSCMQIKTEAIDVLADDKPSAAPGAETSKAPSTETSKAPSTTPSVNPGGNSSVAVPSVTPTNNPAKQTIKVSKKASKTIIYKAKNLKKKKATFHIDAKAKTKLTYSVSKKTKKYISVSKSGQVTIKKGCKKGTYKITIVATKSKAYQKATKTITIKVK